MARQTKQTSLTDGELFGNLAQVANAVGNSSFYDAAINAVSNLFKTERSLVIRYAQYSKPEFLLNTAMTETAVQQYLEGYFRIDPLLRMVRTGVTEQVLTFNQLKKSGSDTLFYEEVYKSARILDELVLMLPTVGGVWTALCVDRFENYFTDREVEQARQIFPLIEKLHALHVNHCVFGWRGGYLDDSEIAFMMIDSEGNPAHKNALWKSKFDAERENQLLQVSANQPEGLEALDDDRIVHWETLDLQNAVAPGGKAFLLEENSPGYVDLGAADIVEQFAGNYNLTPRETEIIGFIIQGHPPSLIAETMGLSVGTVRNHKHRLYYKLDITTERELFCMFFDLMMGKSPNLAAQ